MDSFSQLQAEGFAKYMYWGALISRFLNILVYLNKLENNFKTARKIFFFKKIKFPVINGRFIWPVIVPL